MTDDADLLGWLGVERPSTSVSGQPEPEPEPWVSPARTLLEERAERNRHPEGCGCVRCSPLVHGAYAELGEEARELAVALAPLLPAPHPSDSLAVELLATAVLRTRRAMAALEAADEERRLEDALRLSQDARGWLTRAERLAERLGLTPTSRASLGLVEAQTAQARVAAVLGVVDVSRWSEEELATVERLLAKATPKEARR